MAHAGLQFILWMGAEAGGSGAETAEPFKGGLKASGIALSFTSASY